MEGEAKAKMIDRLRENFAQHDLCLQTGFLGTYILMATLTENGMEDIAYELLFQRKAPLQPQTLPQSGKSAGTYAHDDGYQDA